MKSFLALLTIVFLASSEPLKIKSWQVSTNGVTLGFNVRSNVSYSVVRYGCATKWYSLMTNFVASSNAVASVTVNPMEPSDEDEPAPSGQCYFYLVGH